MELEKHKPKALLFDLDGTLVDTIGDITYAVNVVLKSLGASPIDARTCKRYVGHGLRNTLSRAFDDALIPYDANLLSSSLQLLRETYHEHPHDIATLYPGIKRLLEKSVAGGLKLGVLSNKEDSLVRRIVEALLGTVPFVTVQGATEHMPLKPDPSAASAFARHVGCELHEVVMIGDSEVDYRTAVLAGMRPAVVTWGFRDRSDLEASGCAPLYDTMEELEMEVISWQ